MTKPVKKVVTLGERLRREAQRIAERHQVPMAWRSMVTATLEREAARTQSPGARWGRVEADAPLDPPVPSTPSDATDVAMPPVIQNQLTGLGLGQLNGMRLHEGPFADAFARDRRADAVTIGQDVYLRDQPGIAATDRLALLAHEATHVRSFLDPNAAWHRATSAGIREEEARADEAERVAGRSPLVPQSRPAPASPSVAAAPVTASASSPSLRPMTAETGRNAISAAGVPAAPASSGVDMKSIREGLMRDLIDTVRIDAERGG